MDGLRHRNTLLGIVCALGAFSGCQSTRSLLSRTDHGPGLPAGHPVVAEAPAHERSQPPAAKIKLAAADNELSAPTPDELPQSLPRTALRMASAETNPVAAEPTGLSLEQLQQAALANNPSLRQATASAHKAMGFQTQVGLYPNPTAGYNGTQLADEGTDQHTAFVEQDIVTGDKLNLNRNVLAQEVQVQLWELESQRRRVLTDVQQRFYETLGAQRRLELATEFEGISDKAVRITRELRRIGDASQSDVLQAEIQLNEVQLARQKASVSLRAAWDQLAAVIGNPHLPTTKLDGQLPTSAESYDWDQVYQQLIASSPEICTTQAKISRARAQWERQEAQPIPNVSVMVAAGHDRSTGSGLINTQVGVPLPLWNRNQGNTYAAYSEYCRASQDLERKKLALKSRLALAARDYDSAAITVNQYQGVILPKASETLSLSEQAYEVGEVNFLQLLIVRRTYFESNLSFVEAQARLAESQTLVDGMLLSGGLDESPDTTADSGLRDQTLSGQ